MLELRIECDAKLGCLGIGRCQPDTNGKQANPAGASVSSVHLRNDSNICWIAPVLGIDAHTRDLKNFDGAETSRRRIPERHVKPMPKLVLVFSDEGSESEHRCVVA